MLPHFRQRVNESPRQDENFGTFGLFLSFFVPELRPFKGKDKFFQCIFEALFINSANALLLTAVYCARHNKQYLIHSVLNTAVQIFQYSVEENRVVCSARLLNTGPMVMNQS